MTASRSGLVSCSEFRIPISKLHFKMQVNGLLSILFIFKKFFTGDMGSASDDPTVIANSGAFSADNIVSSQSLLLFKSRKHTLLTKKLTWWVSHLGFSNCQRPAAVFSLGVSQHAQNNKPVEIWTQFFTRSCVLSGLILRPHVWGLKILQIF